MEHLPTLTIIFSSQCDTPPPSPTYQVWHVFHEVIVFHGRMCILVICCQLATYIGNFTPHHSTALLFQVYNSGRSKFLVQIRSVGVPKINEYYNTFSSCEINLFCYFFFAIVF